MKIFQAERLFWLFKWSYTIFMFTFLAVAALVIWWPWPLTVRAKWALHGQPSWEIKDVYSLDNGSFLVFQGFGRRFNYFGRFILVSSTTGKVSGQYLHGDSHGRLIGQQNDILWLHTDDAGLHARSVQDLSLVLPKEKVGKGMPPGGWQKYAFDDDTHLLWLLGTDGRYYTIDRAGMATLVKESAEDKASSDSQDQQPAKPASDSHPILPKPHPEVTLSDEEDGRFTLRSGSYSKAYLHAEFAQFHWDNPYGALLTHSDRLGATGKPLLTRIAGDGTEVWTDEVNALVSKRRLPKGTVEVRGIFHAGNDITVFVQEDGKEIHLHAGHIARLDSKSGRVLWSQPLKDY
jgi:hypothetical protein